MSEQELVIIILGASILGYQIFKIIYTKFKNKRK